MRHRKLSRRFSRTSSHRIAMMRNLSISLIEHEVIKTTVEKGKELRRFFEPLVTRAKEDNLHNRRLVISELNSKEAASKLFSDLGPRFKETNGGYIRLIKAGFREGDKADICYVELTCREEAEKELQKIGEEVVEVICEIYDPEIPVNIYALGLIYDVEVSEDCDVKITMTLTSPNCPVAETLPVEVEEKVKVVPAVKDVSVEIVFEPVWTKDMMSEEAKLELGML